MYFCDVYYSPIGVLTVAASDYALVGLWMEGQKYHAAGFEDCLVPKKNHPVFLQTMQWLQAYFAGQKPTVPDFPICPQGSKFQKTVWDMLLQIPYGQAVSYGELARAIGCRSAQAVGGAVGRNPISIIIPCHRVLGRGGSLTGYAGGLEKKQWLLFHEGILPPDGGSAGK